MAAEAFRYKVTASPDAFVNVKSALAGLQSLLDVTGNSLLARCIVPANSPYAAGIASEESRNGIHQAAPYLWVGNTSRDEYVGAIFGLGIAYDVVDDAGVKSSISSLVTLLMRFLTGNDWALGKQGSGDTFLLRPDEPAGAIASWPPCELRRIFDLLRRTEVSAGDNHRRAGALRYVECVLLQVQFGLHDVL